MHKRLKLQKVMILVLAVVISVLFFGTMLGRNKTVEIVVVKKDDIDISKKLDAKTIAEYFEVKKILQSEYKELNGSVYTSLSDLEGKRLQVKINKGAPVLKSLASSQDTSGEFATTMASDHTVFKLTEAVGLLPPGTVAGDRINVALTVETDNQETGEKETNTGVILKNVAIYDIKKNDVYLKVSEQNHLLLATSEKLGQFVLQLPGKKAVQSCSVAEQDVAEKVDKEIKALKKKHPKKNYDRDAMIAEEMNYIDCTNDNDKATTISSEEIINLVKTQSLNSDSGTTDVFSNDSADETATE